MTGSQWRLLALLSVATFFEGFDFLALSQILPSLSEEFGLDHAGAGWVIATCNVGTILAWGLVRMADRYGRRPVLTGTIAGYTVATLLTGLAPTLPLFVAAQLLARMFLLAEWGISMVYAAEEFGADRRGVALGVVQTASSLGSIVCAGVVPMLTHAYGWRSVFFVGVIPLLLLAWARSSLPETRRFTERAPSGDRGLLAVWRSPYRFRVLQLGAIWACTYAATQTSIAFWKEFAVSERGLDDHGVGLALTVASLGALPMVAAVGKLLDVLGRRRGSVIIYALTIVGIVAAYNLHGQWPLTAALVLGIFGASAVLPPLNAWSTELFPTELRSEAYGWANYVVGRSAYVLAPLLAGLAAQHVGWGPAVSATALGPLVALVLILWWLPETAGRELEETART
ncbi:MAG: MFS transporter [Myxococcales bacterium]|nr:MFS transporter [Myxococcales bacterium]